MKLLALLLCTFLIFAAQADTARAHGKSGSPEAATTIGGLQIPPLPQKFEGTIERNAAH